jgi:UDP-N-acetylmuramoylalanine--D-glutamate ligase
MKSLIYGYGITGQSFARYLKNLDINYDIFDNNIPQYNKLSNLENYEAIYCSPGVPKKIFQKLKSANKVLTDLDIFLEKDKSIKICITGTNRKSTTCFHLSQILSKIDSVNLIGNIGEPMLDYMNNGNTYSIIELSSYQLDKMSKNYFNYGVLLNIAEDHLDYHGNFEDYKLAKQKILTAENVSYEADPYELCKWITGIEPQSQNLKDLPFRFQKITDSLINDSKSTNSNSLIYAVNKANIFFNEKNYSLILCGDPKKEAFRKLEIKGPKEILIFGIHRDEIYKCIVHSNKLIFKNLKETLIYLKNKKNILFSPGYPSGNDYKNFEERGSHFNLLTKEILNE